MTELRIESATFETPAAYQPWVHFPITLSQQSGTLRLADGRLSFTRSRGRVVFDGPIGEFHSLAPCYGGGGVHLWQRDRCHVLVFQQYGIPPVAGEGLLGLAISLEAVREAAVDLPRSRALVRTWRALLPTLIAGAPPPGVHVRPPWSTSRFWVGVGAAVLGATAVMLGAIVGLVALTS